MKVLAMIVSAVAGLAVLAGCAPSKSGAAYTRDEVRREQSVRMGVVESVREVQIEGTRSGVGPAAGAVVGGIGGSGVGSGRGASVASVVGAVAGGVAGQAAEEAATRRKGMEITVRLDGGRMVAIVQEADEAFRPGERVRILSDGGVSRVTH
jgi:outer membrane lipoprotein SlyB